MLNFIILQASQNLADGTITGTEAVEPDSLVNVLYQMALNGGPEMIPLIVLSVLALIIFLERLIVIHQAKKLDPMLLSRLREYILDGKFELASNLCRTENTPFSRMAEKGISLIGRSLDEVNAIIKNTGNLEVSRLEKGMPVLASVVGGAPLLGILGTALALIQAFYEIANSDATIDTHMVATFVYQALITTVAGIIVGIVAYLAYNILVVYVRRVIVKLEVATSEFIDILKEPAN